MKREGRRRALGPQLGVPLRWQRVVGRIDFDRVELLRIEAQTAFQGFVDVVPSGGAADQGKVAKDEAGVVAVDPAVKRSVTVVPGTVGVLIGEHEIDGPARRLPRWSGNAGG